MTKMRRKIITTGALTSRKLASLSHEAERVYWRTYMASDNFGTMSADPWDVWHQACPGVTGMSEEIVDDCIEELLEVGLVQRWEKDGSEYLHIVGHDSHQSADFIRKRGDRRSPKPPEINKSALRATLGAEGQGTASGAEVCPRGTQGHHKESVSVSVKGSDSVSVESPKRSLAEAVPATPPRRIKAPINFAEQIEIAKAKLGANADMVTVLVAIMAEKNKSGTVAVSRTYRELWAPIAATAELLTTAQVAYGLQAAIKKGAPNANYVRSAAEGYEAQAAMRPIAQPRLSDTTDDQYDAIFGSTG